MARFSCGQVKKKNPRLESDLTEMQTFCTLFGFTKIWHPDANYGDIQETPPTLCESVYLTLLLHVELCPLKQIHS